MKDVRRLQCREAEKRKLVSSFWGDAAVFYKALGVRKAFRAVSSPLEFFFFVSLRLSVACNPMKTHRYFCGMISAQTSLRPHGWLVGVCQASW
jgi:hypothetical protein